MKRVAITGIGILAANGSDKETFWQALLAGRSGVGPVTLFDASRLRSQIAAEVKDFNPAAYELAPRKIKREARNTQLALAAASLALTDAGLRTEQLRGFGPPVVAMGVSTSSFDIIQNSIRTHVERGSEYASPRIITTSGIQMPANMIAAQLGVPAEPHTLATACAAGQDAIAFATDAIRSGRTDIAIAGGSDAPISEAPFADFCACRMVSTRNHDPEHASRPFDRDRDGGVLGEGAGILVLESLEHARDRGATLYAELAGSAVRADPPQKSHGAGLRESMRIALANAGCLSRDIDYICAHGPSDPNLDRTETAMIKDVFGAHASRLVVSSIKGVTGNPLAAAGALQIAVAALAIRHQIVPMTANFRHPDPLCDLDYVVEGSRRQVVRQVLVNNHGITGGNSSTIVRDWDVL